MTVFVVFLVVLVLVISDSALVYNLSPGYHKQTNISRELPTVPRGHVVRASIVLSELCGS